jgi:cytoskeletal protein RodZ
MIQHRKRSVMIAACATLTLAGVLTACGGGDSRTRNAEVTTTLDENGNAPSTTLFDWQAGSSTTLGEGSTDSTEPTQSTEPGTVETTVPGETTTTAAAVASSQNVISPTDASDGDSFGGAVALSADGKTLAVGALYDDVSGNADQGSVTVYGRSGKSWTEEKVLVVRNRQCRRLVWLFSGTVSPTATPSLLVRYMPM